jgi:predicted Rossmann fold flavoprotein
MLQVSSYWSAGGTIIVNAVPELSSRSEAGTTAEAFFQEHRTNQTRQTNQTSRGSNALVKNVLAALVPVRFLEEFCAAYAPALVPMLEKPFSSISKQDFMRLVELLQTWQFQPNGTEGYAKAEVVAGGVDTDELSQKTLESKKVRGLYFIGEVVDVTGWLGGYNFQWAWSSGVAAGRAVCGS